MRVDIGIVGEEAGGFATKSLLKQDPKLTVTEFAYSGMRLSIIKGQAQHSLDRSGGLLKPST